MSLSSPPTAPVHNGRAALASPTATRRHVFDLDDFTASEIEDVLDTAAVMKSVLARPIKKVPTLRGKTVVTLFYEASTRTRVGFEVAAKALGADTIGVNASTSSVTKGESLIDTIRTLQALGADFVVMRHPQAGAPYVVAEEVSASVINAGDGWHAHPTQALLDLFTIRERLGHIAGVRVAIVGDVLHSRVVRSNLWGLTHMGAEVVLVRTAHPPAPGQFPPPPGAAVAGADRVPARTRARRGGRGHGAATSDRTAGQRSAAERPRVRAPVRADRRAARLGPAGRAGHAPRADERRRRDRPARRARRAIGYRDPGHQRRGRAHGAALSAQWLERTGRIRLRAPLMRLRLSGGRILDPSTRVDRPGDLLLEDDRIVGVTDPVALPAADEQIVDVNGAIVAPGFVDLHCRLGEPGFEDKETVASGTRAAAAGGFTTVCALPDTQPPTDTGSDVEALLTQARRDAVVRVLPIGTVTKRRAGQELSEMADMEAAGAIGFSDDGRPIRSSRLLRHALEYSLLLDRPIGDFPQDAELAAEGVMNEGALATRLGLRGVPHAAEEIAVARDLALARLTGGRLHLTQLSTAGAVEQVRAATARRAAGDGGGHTPSPRPERSMGSRPRHRATRTRRTLGRSHPLRTGEDAAALLDGLRDGTIDAIVTDHRPQRWVDKAVRVRPGANRASLGWRPPSGCSCGWCTSAG